MKILIQRVLQAKVSIDHQSVAQINEGLLLLVGFGRDDNPQLFEKATDKILNLRIFSDDKVRFQYSTTDQKMSLLVVPQFTLYSNTNAGRRPDFMSAMAPGDAKIMFSEFSDFLENKYPNKVQFGVFGADMQVSLTNDGPVTIMIEI